VNKKKGRDTYRKRKKRQKNLKGKVQPRGGEKTVLVKIHIKSKQSSLVMVVKKRQWGARVYNEKSKGWKEVWGWGPEKSKGRSFV